MKDDLVQKLILANYEAKDYQYCSSRLEMLRYLFLILSRMADEMDFDVRDTR